MELNEKEYSLNLIKNFNKKITFKLFNLTKNNIIFFLDFNFCNKEYLIILNKIKLLFNSKQINIFTKIIDKNVNNHTDANIIAKYYIKLTHLFSSIFNIISNNNITVKKNKINIPFNIFLIPELNYIYKSKFDLNTNKYILGQADKILYNKHLTNFCNFFLNNSEIIVNNYSDINCSNITNNKSHSHFTGYLQTKLDNTKKAKAMVNKIVEEFVESGVTKKELQAAKNFLLGSEPLRSETFSQRLNRAFHLYYKHLPFDYPKKELKKINSLTVDELNTFIQKHQEINKLSFSIVTK